VKRKGAGSRPPIPEWAVDVNCWEPPPGAGEQTWQAARDEWLDYYGYDVFDLNDAELEYRTRGVR
jgi:hypothetical protein